MENPKICIGLDFTQIDPSNALEVTLAFIDSLEKSSIDYLALDLFASSIRRPLDLDKIDSLCREREISWFPIVSSIRDINSTRPYYSKLPNGRLGFMLGISGENIWDHALLSHAKGCADYIVLYTNCANQSEIDRAIETSEPDLIVHYPIGDTRLDYIKYLQGISIEFDKRYITGFKNNSQSNNLLAAATVLDAQFLESTVRLTESIQPNLIDSLGELRKFAAHRGGYEAKKLNKIERELRKK